ncbi:MAG TPA: MFS transporter [Longimicrobium sp.]|jgi:UMF1 family MFS transporter|uniref:MFS transporter n=1 Tax=Longimicrobium sp. TaxID=2029185 RepID=UPI002ED8AD69
MSSHLPAAASERRGLLNTLGLHRPELRAWAMYDWANSAFICTITNAVFPIYFVSVAAAGMRGPEATARYGWATTIGLAIVAILAPILGTIADYAPVKKRLMGTFMGIGVAATAVMFFIMRGDLLLASILFILANIGANGSFVFYESLLPHIARRDEMDRVSTAAYAMGYIGGGLLLVINLLWIQKPEWFGFPSGEGLTAAQATFPARLSFLSVAVWWLLFSIPVFRRVPEPPVTASTEEEKATPALRLAFSRLGETFRALRGYKQAFLMLIAFLIYNDGIGTIVRMATVFGTELKIDTGTMILAIVIVQFVGVPCAFLFGTLAGKIGAKKSVFLALAVYVGITILGYFMKTGRDFLILAALVGLVQGGAQALSRSLFASMIPRHRSGEFFGFFGVFEKFAGIFGPAIFSVVVATTGTSRNAILAVVVFFIVGGILLAMVDVEEGQRIARAEEERVGATQIV